ncbi:MAG: sulfite exporter TauE/SafE family protein [Bdellovibrio sp.]
MTSTALLALGILSASFFGSWHCAGMCGPIATLMSTRKSLWTYHAGRMISYTALGALSGALGQFFLNSEFVTLRWISTSVLAGLLLIAGVALIFPSWEKFVPQGWSHSLLHVLRRLQSFHLARSGFTVGLLTALLPCGWLYTYVMAALATKSPWAGALTMFLFWLGGLPTLSAVPYMIRSTIQASGLRHQRIAGGVLVAAGLYSLVSFMWMH